MTPDRTLRSLTERTIRGVGFRLVGNLLQAVLSILLGVILARLLPPEEFGLFGLAVAIVTITEMIGTCGVSRALVYKQDLSPEHEAAGAAFQLIGSVVMSSLLVLSSSVAEWFFDVEGLAPIIALQAVVLVTHSIALLPTNRLTRRLAFDRLTIIETSTHLLRGISTIVFALHGMGALALVYGSIVSGLSRTILLWCCAPGRVPLAFRMQHLRDLLQYGVGFLGIDVANLCTQQIDILIIGQQLGSGAVGLYQRAFQLVLLPLRQITSATHKVLFPAMSSIQNEGQRFQRGYLGALSLSALVAFPILTLIWTTADLIIPLVYGSMWTGAIPILQILALSGYFRIVYNTHGLVIQSRGRGTSEARCQGIYLGLIILFAYVGSAAGIVGTAVGVSMACLLFFVLMTRLALSVTGVSLSRLLLALKTGIIGSILLGVSVIVLKTVLAKSIPIGLLWMVSCSFGLLVYVASLRLFLTIEEQQFLERMSMMLPIRFRSLLRLFIGSRPSRLRIGPLLLLLYSKVTSKHPA